MDNDLFFIHDVGLPVLEGDPDPLCVHQIAVFVHAGSNYI